MDVQPTRLSAGARRDATLTAAAEIFARRGYYGATTDQIAREAGISQTYVVRMFGTKEQLFLDVIGQSLALILDEFRAALAAPAGDLSTLDRLGVAYKTLAKQSGIHLPLMHAFALGSDPAIGPAARAGFLELTRFLLEEADLTTAEADGFLARGMLINTLMGLRMDSDPDPLAADLVDRVVVNPR
jgi:TetR/AcrR family transcriptional regulator